MRCARLCRRGRARLCRCGCDVVVDDTLAFVVVDVLVSVVEDAFASVSVHVDCCPVISSAAHKREAEPTKPTHPPFCVVLSLLIGGPHGNGKRPYATANCALTVHLNAGWVGGFETPELDPNWPTDWIRSGAQQNPPTHPGGYAARL